MVRSTAEGGPTMSVRQDMRSIGSAVDGAAGEPAAVRRQQRLGPAETIGATDAVTRRAWRHARPADVPAEHHTPRAAAS